MASNGNTLAESPSELKARATKEELVAEIERLNAIIADQQDQINRQVAKAKSGKHGWMISTPNPSYTGNTAGVYFENGHAFISEDLPNARKKVATLVTDFGYSYTEVDDGQEVKPPEAKKQSIFEASLTPQVMK